MDNILGSRNDAQYGRVSDGMAEKVFQGDEVKQESMIQRLDRMDKQFHEYVKHTQHRVTQLEEQILRLNSIIGVK